MNLFIVPSWYPSKSNPSYGIFIREQVMLMSKSRPEWKIGVSLWGQGDSEKLLWARDHFKNLSKVLKHNQAHGYAKEMGHFSEFYQPTLSWTKKFRKGNLREIIRCNELNFQSHLMKSGKPDFIVAQASYPGALIVKYLSDKYHIPYHVHVRLGGFMFEQLLSDLGSLGVDLLNALESADLVTVTSNFQGESLKKWITDSNVLYNPVDTDFFQLGKSKSEDFVLTISRLESEKGIDLLIESLSNVSDIQLKIVGDGTEKNKLRRLVEQKRLNKRIQFLGEKNRKELSELIQKTQFLILPSKFETFGNVILESMACGKPVVATRSGGPEEIVTKDSGLLCEISTEGLSNKILEMKSNYGSFDSGQIRKYVTKKFSSEIWIGRYEKLLRDLMRK